MEAQRGLEEGLSDLLKALASHGAAEGLVLVDVWSEMGLLAHH